MYVHVQVHSGLIQVQQKAGAVQAVQGRAAQPYIHWDVTQGNKHDTKNWDNPLRDLFVLSKKRIPVKKMLFVTKLSLTNYTFVVFMISDVD